MSHFPSLNPSCLEQIDLSCNQIICINTDKKFEKLRKLYLIQNCLKQMPSLDPFPCLEKYYLCNNQIQGKVRNLRHKKNQKIDLTGNRIQRFEGDFDVPSLKELKLNPVCKLPPRLVRRVDFANSRPLTRQVGDASNWEKDELTNPFSGKKFSVQREKINCFSCLGQLMGWLGQALSPQAKQTVSEETPLIF